jgi:hypothetical protein
MKWVVSVDVIISGPVLGLRTGRSWLGSTGLTAESNGGYYILCIDFKEIMDILHKQK